MSRRLPVDVIVVVTAVVADTVADAASIVGLCVFGVLVVAVVVVAAAACGGRGLLRSLFNDPAPNRKDRQRVLPFYSLYLGANPRGDLRRGWRAVCTLAGLGPM